MKKRMYLTAVLLIFLWAIPASPSKEVKTTEKHYTASTVWVSSIAELAGIENIYTIAPANLKHPPEYEITPNDMVQLMKSDLIFHAGYEKMVKVMTASAEIPEEKLVKVKTTNTLENLTAMIIKLSGIADTREAAEKNQKKLDKLFTEARKTVIEKKLNEIPAFVNINQAEFAKDIGLNVIGTFGPGSLSSDQIAQVAREKYPLVIDNLHSPVTSPGPVVIPESVILVLINFPEEMKNDALIDVLSDNLCTLFENF
ncbi:MAG: hypothetical protein MJ052_05260 [Sphaerochaetaceae bacterium]|nr:hypothetical protein [Sphaerochaetaceae bacterium]